MSRISEIEIKISEWRTLENDFSIKLNEAEKLKSEEQIAREDFELRKGLAEFKGEDCDDIFSNDELKKVELEIDALRSRKSTLTEEILQGLKEVKFDIVSERIPGKIENGRITLTFNKPIDNAVNFLATLLKTQTPLSIDEISLFSDKMLVSKLSERKDILPALKRFNENIGRIARINLKEPDTDVQETAKYLYECNYRDVWEAVKGRKSFSYQEIYNSLGIENNSEAMKRVRNFFTNSKIVLKEKYPFISFDKGLYELSFFGQLVWAAYELNYLENAKETQSTQNQGEPEKNSIDEKNSEEPKKSKSKTTLNGFFDEKKITETIYGKGQ